MTRIVLAVAVGLLAAGGEASSAEHAVKSLAELQLRYVNSRYQAYFHYGINTYDGVKDSWGSGKVSPRMWQPTALDCDQWADVVVAAGMKGGCLTTKHHDGFCLWDSKAMDPFTPGQETTYDVGASPVTEDVVRAFTDAFRRQGLQIGLYYSIWDFHYDIRRGMITLEKKAYLLDQIRELLTRYGPIDYINFDAWQLWHDIPYYDEVPYYEVHNLVKSLQPECLIVNHQYETNLAHSDVPFADASGGTFLFPLDYMRPAAASDNLNRGWFWYDGITIRRTADQILENLDTYNSHNAVYTLNVAPNPAGLIPGNAIEVLTEVAGRWKRPDDIVEPGDNWGHTYDVSANLAFMKPVKQSSTDSPVRDKRATPRAEIALDGVTEGDSHLEQVSLTRRAVDPSARETCPWWQVDLLTPSEIDSITIYFRTDGQAAPLCKYYITLLDDRYRRVWSHNFQREHPTPSIAVPVGGERGRHVRITLDGKDQLALAEVIVAGSAIPTDDARVRRVEEETN